jgi:hypothetical protein
MSMGEHTSITDYHILSANGWTLIVGTLVDSRYQHLSKITHILVWTWNGWSHCLAILDQQKNGNDVIPIGGVIITNS